MHARLYDWRVQIREEQSLQSLLAQPFIHDQNIRIFMVMMLTGPRDTANGFESGFDPEFDGFFITVDT